MSDGSEVKRSALIVTDMFNTYDHEDADALTSSVEHMHLAGTGSGGRVLGGTG